MIAAAYVIVAPRSEDLAAHLLRAKLFSATGFGIWNNWWYAGHNVPGYSVLFPPLGALLTPQLAAALAVPVSAALFDELAHRRFGETAWLGSLCFAIAASTSLFTGRLTFALGLAGALATALALQRNRTIAAVVLAVLTALASPVDALFAALAGTAQALAAGTEHRRLGPALPGLAVIAASAAPVLALAVAFPEGGVEPFAFSALWPIVVIAALTVYVLPREDRVLRAGAVLYAIGCVASYAVPSPVGSNITRLAPLVALPLAALLWWPRRTAALLAAALPLLYLQWQAPVRDIRTADDKPEVSSAYFQPLLGFLTHQPGPVFRVEIPFSVFHWEAYAVAPRFPLARGWERQLDTKYNALFYDGTLTPPRYETWLHELAVRFVAVSDAKLDYSAKREVALIDRGLPYLHLVFATRHWRVYAVENATPIATGAAALTALGPNSMDLLATRPGTALIRVRWSPYWALTNGSGCMAPENGFTRLEVSRAGPLHVAIRFALSRVGASSPRCS